MYEGTFDQAVLDPASEGAALRQLSWAELSARLAAARDLRAVLRPDAGCGGASFAAGAAAHLAPRDEDTRNVNPDDLGAGKSPGGISGSPADEMPGATESSDD